jgi:hypothetical protein
VSNFALDGDYDINAHGEIEELSESISIIRARDGLRINLSLPDLGHPDKPALWKEIHRHNTLGGELICGKNHPKSVRQYADGSRWAYHLNKGDSTQHGPSPEHEAVADWLFSRAERHGFRVERERTSQSGLFRNDVYVEGDSGIRLGLEVQYSPVGRGEINQRSGLIRTNRMLREQVSPLWIAPKSNDSGIRDTLPCAIFQDMPLEIVRAGHDIRVIAGPAKCDLIDHYASPQDCPRREGRPCTGLHPRLRSRGLDLDDMLERAGTGELVVIRRKAQFRGRNVSVLHYITPRHRDRFLENSGVLEPLAVPLKIKKPRADESQREREFTLACSRLISDQRNISSGGNAATPSILSTESRACVYINFGGCEEPGCAKANLSGIVCDRRTP